MSVGQLFTVILLPVGFLFTIRRMIDSAVIYTTLVAALNLILQAAIQREGAAEFMLIPLSIFAVMVMKSIRIATLLFFVMVLAFVLKTYFMQFFDYTIPGLESDRELITQFTFIMVFIGCFLVIFQTRATSRDHEKRINEQKDRKCYPKQ